MMISFESIRLEIHGLEGEELGRWIGAELVRAEGGFGAWRFTEIDAARVRLIWELRHGLEVEERSLPVVLSLLDQVYDMRRRMARLNGALGELPEDVRARLVARLGSL
jgi:chaperone modulatory protein CbpM